ncbi:MAG: CTP-dependent riboflavin kinase [Candidatus Bathyarchaeota archaeon]
MVSSGNHQGEKFVSYSWVKKQLARKLGFTPYPGTLNIKLSSSEYKRKTLIEKAEVREIVPVEGFKKGLCLSKVSINGVNCAIIIPEVPDYPEDMLEIIAPINLRKKLGLKDGDTVEVKVSMK